MPQRCSSLALTTTYILYLVRYDRYVRAYVRTAIYLLFCVCRNKGAAAARAVVNVVGNEGWFRLSLVPKCEKQKVAGTR